MLKCFKIIIVKQ